MANKYVDCTVQNGIGTETGSGTEASPYVTMIAAYNASLAGDVVYVKSTLDNPYQPTSSITDSRGITFRNWDFAGNPYSKFHVDCAGISNYAFVGASANSKILNAEFYNIPATFYGTRATNAKSSDYLKDCLFRDSGGYGLFLQHSSGIVSIRNIIFRRVGGGFRCETGGGTLNVYNCQSFDMTFFHRIRNGAIVNTYNFVSLGATTYEFLLDSSSVANHYNPILVGGGKNAAYNVIENTGTSSTNIFGGVATFPVLDSGDFLKGYDGSVLSPATLTGTESGFNPRLFSSPRRRFSVALCRDDLNNYLDSRPANTGPTDGLDGGTWDTWLDILEARGLKGTYPLSTQLGLNENYMSSADWANVNSVLLRNKGHEISTHGRTGYHVNNNATALTVINSGAGVTISISNGVLTSSGASNNLNINLNQQGLKVGTNAKDGNPNTGLLNIIEQSSGWTATLLTGAPNNSAAGADAAPANILADISNVNASSLATLSIDDQRAYEFEYLGNKNDIKENTGYVVKSHVYSAGSYNAGMSALLKTGGWLGGRVGTAPNSLHGTTQVDKFPVETGYDSFLAFGILTGNSFDRTSEETLKRSVFAVLSWASYWGVPLVLYNHQFGNTGGGAGNPEVSEEEMGWICDVIKETGAPNETFGEQCAWSASAALTASALNDSDDNWTPSLSASASSIVLGSTGTSSGPSRAVSYISSRTAAATSYIFTLQPSQEVQIFAVPALNANEYVTIEVNDAIQGWRTMGIVVNQLESNGFIVNNKRIAQEYRLTKSATRAATRIESN